MSEMITLPTVDQSGFKHSRKDQWWVKPLAQFIFLLGFIVYSTWRIMIGFDNIHIEGTHYVSPFFANPFGIPGTADGPFANWPSTLSPALMLIWIPLGFRFTCYYARKVYHRAFLADPPACAVSELRKVDLKYKGENKLPFVVSNFHRYFFYLAFILAVFHVIDFFLAFSFEHGTETRFGVGTLLLGMDAAFLSLYVLSCHSCKHLVGGGLNCFSCNTAGNARYKSWTFVKKLNEKHHLYFWLSLSTLILADIYIQALASGSISMDFDKWKWF
ncbi:MAG: hypothetical protein INQ03_07195 [Candidatus Heimdallarchaeota archaeon]|nr:hypothetical protein [Candidatus Heimdallarchaeota archaeon]